MTDFLATKVDPTGITSLITRLGRDCSAEQHVREFIQNAIEAVGRTHSQKKKILVDCNWDTHRQQDVHKLCFIDNGDGMTGDEMLQHLNNLSSSGHHNKHENYGVGAKISALTRNHEGVHYESWKNGVGNSVLIKYDSESGIYGVEPIVTPDGRRFDYFPLSEEHKHKIIDQHGTRVTLLGMHSEQDTMLPPEGMRGGRENWLLQYANTRFFRLPKDIEIQVRVGYYRDPKNKKHNYTRKVEGQDSILNSNSVDKGEVQLSCGAKVLWWIMDPDRKDDKGRQFTIGHTACIKEDEVLNVLHGRANKAAGFGIIFGKEDIVLYVEPGDGYVQTTSRSHLVREDGSPLPWDRWQDEFRENMPDAIKKFIDGRMSRVGDTSHSDSIRSRLKTVAHLFKISRYRPVKNGQIKSDPSQTVASKVGVMAGQGKGAGGAGGHRQGSGNSSGGHRAQLYSDLLDAGVPSVTVSPDKFPTVHWVSVQDGTRDNDEMEDRAASFCPATNTIKANADFQGVVDLINHFCEEYASDENGESLVVETVREAFEQQLTEAVMGVMSLKNRPKWNSDDFEKTISEESLTLAVLPKWHLLNFIKQDLGKKLRKKPKAPVKSSANGKGKGGKVPVSNVTH